jgi:hypothetical protein
MDVTLVPSEAGLRLTTRGWCMAVVDTSQGTIEISARQGGQRSFAASHAGLDAAVTTLENICAFALRSSTPSTGTQESVAQPDFRSALVEALRANAAQCEREIARVEAAIAAEEATPFVFSRGLLRARYFIKDVLRFRAAAIAAAHIEKLVAAHLRERVDVVDALGGKLDNWRALFAPHGRVTRALNKTITELSEDASVSGDDLWALAGVRLERPVQSPLHLKILAERARTSGGHRNEHLSMIQQADSDELLELRRRVAEALEVDALSEDEENHLLAEAIASGGARERNERLGRLVQRSIVEAMPLRQAGIVDSVGGAGGIKATSLTAEPPVPPPPGAVHLRTAAEIVREGQAMQHCVGTHAVGAVKGQCYVFHIELDGEPITVEVDVYGYVVDAAGRRNAKTAAVHQARALFTKWGEGFPDRP